MKPWAMRPPVPFMCRKWKKSSTGVTLMESAQSIGIFHRSFRPQTADGRLRDNSGCGCPSVSRATHELPATYSVGQRGFLFYKYKRGGGRIDLKPRRFLYLYGFYAGNPL